MLQGGHLRPMPDGGLIRIVAIEGFNIKGLE